MTRFFDGKKLLTISISDWEGTCYSPDYEEELLIDDSEFDEEIEAYIVSDAEYVVTRAYDLYNCCGDEYDADFDKPELEKYKLDYKNITCPQCLQILNEDYRTMCLHYDIEFKDYDSLRV